MSRSLHEIRLGVYASEEQVAALSESITRLLCPDPEHAGPCLVPWSVSSGPAADADYPEILQQAVIEGQMTEIGPSKEGQ